MEFWTSSMKPWRRSIHKSRKKIVIPWKSWLYLKNFEYICHCCYMRPGGAGPLEPQSLPKFGELVDKYSQWLALIWMTGCESRHKLLCKAIARRVFKNTARWDEKDNDELSLYRVWKNIMSICPESRFKRSTCVVVQKQVDRSWRSKYEAKDSSDNEDFFFLYSFCNVLWFCSGNYGL